MPLKIGVPGETASGERRVAVDPAIARKLQDLGIELLIEKNAGQAAGFGDTEFAGANLVDHKTLFNEADIILCVQPPALKDIKLMKGSAVLIGTLAPFRHTEVVNAVAEKGITSFAMELVPRISRAQAMDVLSSQAAVAGYKAAIMGADLSCRFFPMLTTAAGTIRPSRVIVIGAGVAGLQAIATSRRLGAIVEGYDVRSATREQVESLGAKFINLAINAEGEGGYARALSPEERAQQQAELADYIAKADVLITTASVPGKPAPKIIPVSTVDMMKKGAVIIDLAAEGGGNCELTEPGETRLYKGVVIHGPLNVPSQVPLHASEMYARNLFNFLSPWLKHGSFSPDWDDEVIKGALLTRDKVICNSAVANAIEGA